MVVWRRLSPGWGSQFGLAVTPPQWAGLFWLASAIANPLGNLGKGRASGEEIPDFRRIARVARVVARRGKNRRKTGSEVTHDIVKAAIFRIRFCFPQGGPKLRSPLFSTV